tara:strand:- start:1283 stop:1738 length:456 start_codon:yes stop_codon:yes gene_type:complete
MKLTIMRHGQAEPIVSTDASRPLTPQGEAQAYEAACSAEGRHIQPEILLVSPLLRAQQTALQVQRVFSTVNIETYPGLSPDEPPLVVTEYLDQRSENDIMLISHQPLVSRLVEWLTGEQLFLDTANIACVDVPNIDDGGLSRWQGELVWVI